MLTVVAGVLGLAAGLEVHRRATAFRPRLEPAAGKATSTPEAVAPPEGWRRVPRAVTVGATGVLFALAVVRFGISWPLPAFLFLAAAGVLLAAVDLRHHLLPNRIVGPSAAVGGGLLALAAIGSGSWGTLLRSVAAALVLAAGYLLLALISPGSLGMGDVKLAGLLGLYLGWVGWSAVVVGTVTAFVVQALLAVLLLAARRVQLRGELPFGPAMLAGAAIGVAWGPQLAAWYLTGAAGA